MVFCLLSAVEHCINICILGIGLRAECLVYVVDLFISSKRVTLFISMPLSSERYFSHVYNISGIGGER